MQKEIIDRLKKEGALLRNSGTHSIKSVKEILVTNNELVTSSLNSIQGLLLSQNSILSDVLDVQKQIAKTLDENLTFDQETERDRRRDERLNDQDQDPEPEKKSVVSRVLGTAKNILKKTPSILAKIVTGLLAGPIIFGFLKAAFEDIVKNNSILGGGVLASSIVAALVKHPTIVGLSLGVGALYSILSSPRRAMERSKAFLQGGEERIWQGEQEYEEYKSGALQMLNPERYNEITGQLEEAARNRQELIQNKAEITDGAYYRGREYEILAEDIASINRLLGSNFMIPGPLGQVAEETVMNQSLTADPAGIENSRRSGTESRINELDKQFEADRSPPNPNTTVGGGMWPPPPIDLNNLPNIPSPVSEKDEKDNGPTTEELNTPDRTSSLILNPSINIAGFQPEGQTARFTAVPEIPAPTLATQVAMLNSSSSGMGGFAYMGGSTLVNRAGDQIITNAPTSVTNIALSDKQDASEFVSYV